jgi:putative Mg2+ transporter-C (MgtC) family protein
MRTGISVQGLTTAAALWLVGAIGMAAGSGMYLLAIFVTITGVIALTVLRRFEDKDDRTLRRKVYVLLGGEGSVGDVSARMRAIGVTLSAVEYDRHVADKTVAVTLDVRFPQTLGIEKLIEELESQRDVRRVRLEQVG